MSYKDLREWIQIEWRDRFPAAAEISAERRSAVIEKWRKELFS